MTETIRVHRTEFDPFGPVNITHDGRRIPARDLLAIPSVRFEAYGRTTWFRFGREHREDGPAVIRDDGGTEWFRDGDLHREDDPAVTCSSGAEQWWINGMPHRDFGPAIIHEDGTEVWFLRGRHLRGVPEWIATNPDMPHWSEWTDHDWLHFKLRWG
jgi:hypothetical protein